MDIMDELAAGFDETWGFDDKQWKEIGVFENMMERFGPGIFGRSD